MPRLVIYETTWPAGIITNVDMDIPVRDFEEATQKLDFDLKVTADRTFRSLVLSKWHETHGNVHHQNGESALGFKFLYIP